MGLYGRDGLTVALSTECEGTARLNVKQPEVHHCTFLTLKLGFSCFNVIVQSYIHFFYPFIVSIDLDGKSFCENRGLSQAIYSPGRALYCSKMCSKHPP